MYTGKQQMKACNIQQVIIRIFGVLYKLTKIRHQRHVRYTFPKILLKSSIINQFLSHITLTAHFFVQLTSSDNIIVQESLSVENVFQTVVLLKACEFFATNFLGENTSKLLLPRMLDLSTTQVEHIMLPLPWISFSTPFKILWRCPYAFIPMSFSSS